MIAFSDSTSAIQKHEVIERLGDEIAELAAHLHSATYRLLVRLREFDEREGWGGGFLSCAHWLSWRTGIAPGAAREKVRVARALADLSRFGAAMERGELSFSKVRALTRIATPTNEEELLELARHATAAQIERVVRAWRRIDRVEEAADERARHEGRYLSVYIEEDGSYVVRGRLDPEVGALLQSALDAAAKALYDEDRSTSGDREPFRQRRADALGLLLDLALSSRALVPTEIAEDRADASPLAPETQESQSRVAPLVARANNPSDAIDIAEDPRVVHASTEANVAETQRKPSRVPFRAGRVQIVLHVDAEAMRLGSEVGQSVLGDGVHVSAETSRRIACDASRVVMTHDGAGKVLDVGRRTRVISPALRRALEHRDRGCRFPGCGNRFTDAHHLEHWADGGATRLDNLVLLCRRHHRLVHEQRWRVTRSDPGEFVFSRPDGRVLEVAPPMPACYCQCATTTAATAPSTAASPPFERLDLDLAMLTMYRPRAMESDTSGRSSAA